MEALPALGIARLQICAFAQKEASSSRRVRFRIGRATAVLPVSQLALASDAKQAPDGAMPRTQVGGRASAVCREQPGVRPEAGVLEPAGGAHDRRRQVAVDEHRAPAGDLPQPR